MKLNLNTAFLVIAAVAVLGGIYWYFFTGSAVAPPLTAGPAQNPAQAQFETLIGELAPITFDLAILSDPRFNALVDLATPVAPEVAGRPDPFAPLPGVSAK